MHCTMMPISTKRMQRIEKKKMKMAALVNLTKLNDIDRAARLAKTTANGLSDTGSEEQDIEPSAKRSKTEDLEKASTLLNGDTEVANSSCEIRTTATGKPFLVGEDYLALKQRLKERERIMKTIPNFRLREAGDNASLSVEYESRTPIFMSDVQHLLLQSQLGHHSPYSPQRWCQLEKYNRIQHTVVLIVENISVFNYLSNETLFPTLSANFTDKVEVITPGSYKSDIVQDIGTVPITATQMKRFIREYGSLEVAATKSLEVFDMIKGLFPVAGPGSAAAEPPLPKGDKFPRTHLLMSGWQMIEENYPLPIKGLQHTKYKGYALTKDSYAQVTANSPMFGIDCEMCKTTCGDLELTRVSMVDENLEVVYEQLVKPANRITDYLTQFSGITPKMMVGVTKTLQGVQEDLKQMLPADAILVGQSLNNDMHAMKLMHPYVIDTSIIFNLTGERSRKTKLSILAKEFLAETIQSGLGHCSIEDSASSLKLAQKKLMHSLEYGDAVLNGIKDIAKRHYAEVGDPNYATSMLKHITKTDKRCLVVGGDDAIARWQRYCDKKSAAVVAVDNAVTADQRQRITLAAEKSNKAVVKKACDMAIQHSLTIAQVKVQQEQVSDVDNNAKTFKLVDKWVKQAWTHTAPHGLCVVVFGGQTEGANGCCFIAVKKQTNNLI